VPPYHTLIDQFPHRPHFPVPDQHSGSKTIRNAIEFHQPLASLHGYAHDARAHVLIGKTHSFNPGAEYYRGRLPGLVLEIDAAGRLTHLLPEDPQVEATYATDDALFWQVVRAIIKNTVPFVGTAIKIHDDIRKAIEETHKEPGT
jgi:hypothetical protein